MTKTVCWQSHRSHRNSSILEYMVQFHQWWSWFLFIAQVKFAWNWINKPSRIMEVVVYSSVCRIQKYCFWNIKETIPFIGWNHSDSDWFPINNTVNGPSGFVDSTNATNLLIILSGCFVTKSASSSAMPKFAPEIYIHNVHLYYNNLYLHYAYCLYSTIRSGIEASSNKYTTIHFFFIRLLLIPHPIQ